MFETPAEGLYENLTFRYCGDIVPYYMAKPQELEWGPYINVEVGPKENPNDPEEWRRRKSANPNRVGSTIVRATGRIREFWVSTVRVPEEPRPDEEFETMVFQFPDGFARETLDAELFGGPEVVLMEARKEPEIAKFSSVATGDRRTARRNHYRAVAAAQKALNGEIANAVASFRSERLQPMPR